MPSKRIRKSVGKHKKQLHKGTCSKCGDPVTLSGPKKSTECWKCRGWTSHKQVVSMPKQPSKKSDEKKESNVFHNILKALHLKSDVVVITSEKE